MVLYTIVEYVEEDMRGGERIERVVDHLRLPPIKENAMGLLHDVTMKGELKASFEFQGAGFGVEITCKDVPEEAIMEEMDRMQSILQDRVNCLQEPTQEHLDTLLDLREKRK